MQIQKATGTPATALYHGGLWLLWQRKNGVCGDACQNAIKARQGALAKLRAAARFRSANGNDAK